MTIQYPTILDRAASRALYSLNDDDFILYALALGFGEDPLDARRLAFVVEPGLRIVPTMPTVLAWIAEPTFTALGVDPLSALHGEQKIEIHHPLTEPLTIEARGKVIGVYDKGAGRGALVVTQHELFGMADGVKMATLTTTCFARGEGGCGSAGLHAPQAHQVPDREPDDAVEYRTRADLALLYRLTGDRNPIHADPQVARAAGFPRPILHGLCSFGLTCRAVLERFADYDPARITSHQARFTAPMYPGETLRVELWRSGGEVSFRGRVVERGVVVVSNGKAVIR